MAQWVALLQFKWPVPSFLPPQFESVVLGGALLLKAPSPPRPSNLLNTPPPPPDIVLTPTPEDGARTAPQPASYAAASSPLSPLVRKIQLLLSTYTVTQLVE